MDNATETGILIFVAFVGGIFVLRYLLNVAVDKGRDSIRNARVRNQEANNPPQKERLADRYYGTPAGKSLNLPERQVSAPASTAERPVQGTESVIDNTEEQLLFCPYCGMDLSELEKDDCFCPNCGQQLR